MKNKNQNNAISDDLSFEIELKKARLALKTGMHFETNEDNYLPPEIESAFLDTIEKFEEAWQKSGKISVFEKLGKPEFKKENVLSNREISGELKKIREALNKQNLYVDTICPVDDRTLYNFITEELIHHEMDDLHIPDMMVGFTYEDFHPNYEHDIKLIVSRFIRELLEKNDFNNSLINRTTISNNEEVLKFCNAFENLTIHHFNINHVQVTNDVAKAFFQIKFTGNIDRASGNVLFMGPGFVSLVLKGNCWNITRLVLPS